MRQEFTWASCEKVNNLHMHVLGDEMMATHFQNAIGTKTNNALHEK